MVISAAIITVTVGEQPSITQRPTGHLRKKMELFQTTLAKHPSAATLSGNKKFSRKFLCALLIALDSSWKTLEFEPPSEKTVENLTNQSFEKNFPTKK